MLFPHASSLPASEAWALEAAEKTGIAVSGARVNLPRHPSQLYEMIFEGVILWAIIWLLRNRKPFKGFLVGLYFFGYGVFRFFIEYFREPDEDLGYRIEFVKTSLPPAYIHPPLSFSTGQILSFWMIAFVIVWIIVCSRLPDREAVRLYGSGRPAADPLEKASERNKRRKLRKKLR
jgi:phosphatidylglycerol:prolipoprotein diacylglycerol transferase